jgi:hypothetical protein
MSLFSPSRCVLLLNDEGLGIYDASGGRVQLLETVLWDTQDFEEAVTQIIRRKCRGKSLLLLNDMVEQHYRKERIPRVGALDRANVLKRRVAAAFPSYPIRSAIKLKEKAPNREGQKGGDIYLLAAVPLSDNVRKTLAVVQKSYASIAGFSLLPVESAGMVQALSKKLSKITEKPSVWSIFVGQHHSGGLRQIVTKNGELALTRMTPIVDSDIDQEVWTTEVANEIKGTMSYLSRFGFDTSDGLDVTVIANNSVADRVAGKIDFECNLNVLTSGEAAKMLGLKMGRQEEMRYADPIHVAWTARKSKLALPLQAVQLEAISNPARMATAASVVLLAACCYFGYGAFSQLAMWNKNSSDIDSAEQNLVQLRSEHQAELEKKKAAGIDFILIENSTKVYDKLEKRAMKPLGILDVISKSLGPDISIASLEATPVDKDEVVSEDPLAMADPAAAPPDPDAPAPARQYQIVIRIVFPAALAPEKGVQKIEELVKRLQANLPEHKIGVLKQVADLSYTGNFVGEATSQLFSDGQKQDYEAQIVIKGAML